MKKNVILEKSKQFALRIIKLYIYLRDDKREGFYQSNCFAVERVLAQTFEKRNVHNQMRIFMQNYSSH
jgi:hypothetical protein